jgi:hypothetical protein
MTDPTSGYRPSDPTGPNPWPPPDSTPVTDLPLVVDDHPASRWREVLAVLGIIAAVAVILIAVAPFLDDEKDEIVKQPTPVSTLPPGGSLATSTTVAPTTLPLETTTTAPPLTVGPLPVAAVAATCVADASSDSQGNPVTFAPENTLDGQGSTAWRCPGDATGQTLTFTLAAPATVTQVGLTPGYATVDQFNGDDRFVQNRRIISANWSCLDPAGNSTATAPQTFADDRALQPIDINGFVGCQSIRLEITSVTPPGGRDFTAISDVAFTGG